VDTRILQGAIAKAEELGIKINVAVCDAGGRLLAFNRMDSAIWGGSYGSMGKAVASAAFGRPSGEMQERAAAQIVQGIMMAEGGHMIPARARRRLFAMAKLKGPAGSAAAPAMRTKIAPAPELPDCKKDMYL